MTANVTTAELAAALIRVFEGLRLTAYRDMGGVLTIGFGHTGPDVIEGQIITADRAAELLAEDAKPLFALVAGRPLLEAAALVSFGYNCGAAALERVIAGHALPGQFIHDHHGNEQPGLVARRALEELLIAVSQQKAV